MSMTIRSYYSLKPSHDEHENSCMRYLSVNELMIRNDCLGEARHKPQVRSWQKLNH